MKKSEGSPGPPEYCLINPDVTWRRIPDGAVLYNPDTDEAVGINAVGLMILRKLERPRTREETIARVRDAFRTEPPKRIEADVEDYFRDLLARGFIGRVSSEPGVESGEGTACGAAHAPRGFIDPDRGRFYRGRSMAGTFHAGDYLIVEPAPIEEVRSGDVVVFRKTGPEGETADIVHRVESVVFGGLVTRGDHSRRADDGVVASGALVGRVVRFERKGRVYPVRGGLRGLVKIRFRRTCRRWFGPVLRLVKRGARPIYRALRSGGAVRLVWRPKIVRLVIKAGDEELIKYVHRGRVVAWGLPGTKLFRWRRPYDLAVRPPKRGQ